MTLLEIDGLSVGGLHPWSTALQSGECLVLTGPSGSGKSRLLRAIADLDPHEGEVLLKGQACESIRPCLWRRQVGLLAAESAWWADSVGEHFSVPMDEASLLPLGFTPEVSGWQLARCSSGEKQRLALLRLLQNCPRVLLLDEPTASLDPANVERVEAVILDYLKQEGAAAIWVSHDPQQMERVATRRAQLQGNRIEEIRP